MSLLRVTLMGEGACEIHHLESGNSVRSVRAPEYGGRGDGFSATDLLAAALGSCIAGNLEPVMQRHGVAPGAVSLNVDKQLADDPRRIESLTVSVQLHQDLEPGLITRLQRAAAQCLVHRSLSPELPVLIRFSGV